MKVIAQSGMKYVPKWNKNRKLPEDEQTIIEWNYLSGVQKDLIFGFGPIEYDTDGEVSKKFVFNPDKVEVLRTSIRSIINLDVDEVGATRTATVDDICNLPELAGLFSELALFFTTENAESEKKN